MSDEKKRIVYLILHNIRSAYNVGSIFRTADAAGVGKIFLTGYTPAPVDRFGRANKEIAKTALGAERTVSWEKYASIKPLLHKLRREGAALIALEQSPHSIDYKKIRLPKKAALIFGNEVAGLSPAVLKQADIIAEIPMRGCKESLNVSVAAGIALFLMLRI
ncbi:MAG: tRNA/rRNA methyltransferase SpoU [Parcubacteria group bacterium Gr01-1014_72]|jgi:tRNA G18 (ribose-2'-O)-methylase SpoU|nr:MAG: tRNA/rRNA methyltransferase SpoU [Parcubacteria group bacterium Gr01-1014_72]